MEVEIANRKLPGPILIPSISSFETQFGVLDAITIQGIFREPITLVSAFDVAREPKLNERMKEFRSNGGIVFLDSGGYETSRISRYVKALKGEWSFEAFMDVRESSEFDLCASFDEFIEPDEDIDTFRKRLLERLRKQSDSGPRSLVPVLHLKDYDGLRELHWDETAKLIEAVALEFEPDFIAIPERELGGGIAKKYQLARKIVEKLESRKRPTQLHVLGCGNPLTFMILADAGIAMADGLEWCRTLVGKNYHLHHFQQAELFPEPESDVNNSVAELIRTSGANYQTLTLARNLHALQGLSKKVIEAAEKGSLLQLVKENFGELAGKVLE